MTAPVVQPQPSPVQWKITPLPQAPGGAVVIEAQHVAGSFVGFVDPDTAEQLANGLLQAARQARSGLVVAPAGAVPRFSG
ncbi:MAG: hypothetical protein ACTHMS_23630 [Jatrophihabitans sp.]|uniref:hypothetical protein n=1 Tax=Jatrophihabitans sp. TaxID=1932789 RepID=UPI003F7DDCD2